MSELSTAQLLDAVSEPGTLLLRAGSDSGNTGWLLFRNPSAILTTNRIDKVIPLLQQVDALLTEGQKCLAGMLAYEASPAFDPAMKVRDKVADLPLVWFGVFDSPMSVADETVKAAVGSEYRIDRWQAEVTEEEYRANINSVREYIAAGDSYQVNYTFRMRTPFSGNPFALFHSLYRAQQGAYSAFLNFGDSAILSVSPELFFTKTGNVIRCKPMKGTILRGRYTGEDLSAREQLRESEKDRAENVMIVDMVRNDLGRIAKSGSVQVPALFEIEPLPHVWQMTSTVTAETDVSLSSIFQALFPCASITGAPKIRTTQLIAGLESSPRGVYTGAIGFALPINEIATSLQAHEVTPIASREDQNKTSYIQFNVAIRTVTVNRKTGMAEFGVGGGVVWDSTPEGEYQECLDKANFLFDATPDFSLLETLRWSPRSGYFLLERHLARMRESAHYFSFPFSESELRKLLREEKTQYSPSPKLVRVLLDDNGTIRIEAKELQPMKLRQTWRVGLAREPIDEQDKFYFHKTTNRSTYESFLVQNPNCDDVILWNSKGELTEATKANLILRKNGKYYTPPVICGLLAGTYRADLLARGIIEEAILTLDDLRAAERIYLINSVRGWIRTNFVDETSNRVI